MRVKQPEPFDPNREYNPGERCVYRGMVVIAERWTKTKEELANCPGQSKPEKICGTCRYFNPEFPVNGNPAPVCLALKMIKGGTEYTNPRGTQPHFRCSNGRYEIGISN